jgi:hypothetical protein
MRVARIPGPIVRAYNLAEKFVWQRPNTTARGTVQPASDQVAFTIKPNADTDPTTVNPFEIYTYAAGESLVLAVAPDGDTEIYTALELQLGAILRVLYGAYKIDITPNAIGSDLAVTWPTASGKLLIDADLDGYVTLAPATSDRNLVAAQSDLIPFILQGTEEGQTADMFRIQTALETILLYVNASGKLFATGLDAKSQAITNATEVESPAGSILTLDGKTGMTLSTDAGDVKLSPAGDIDADSNKIVKVTEVESPAASILTLDGKTGLTITTAAGDVELTPTGDIDANSNFIKNVGGQTLAHHAVRKDYVDGRIDRGTSFPGSPVDGQLYFRTDHDSLYFYDSGRTKWRSLTHRWEVYTNENSNNLTAVTYMDYNKSDTQWGRIVAPYDSVIHAVEYGCYAGSVTATDFIVRKNAATDIITKALTSVSYVNDLTLDVAVSALDEFDTRIDPTPGPPDSVNIPQLKFWADRTAT